MHGCIQACAVCLPNRYRWSATAVYNFIHPPWGEAQRWREEPGQDGAEGSREAGRSKGEIFPIFPVGAPHSEPRTSDT